MFKVFFFLILIASPNFASSLKISVEGNAKGEIEIDLFEDVAPLHVAQILKLAEESSNCDAAKDKSHNWSPLKAAEKIEAEPKTENSIS